MRIGRRTSEFREISEVIASCESDCGCMVIGRAGGGMDAVTGAGGGIVDAAVIGCGPIGDASGSL